MSKVLTFVVKSVLGNLYRHLAIFSGHTDRDIFPQLVTHPIITESCQMPFRFRFYLLVDYNPHSNEVEFSVEMSSHFSTQ